VEVSGGVEGLEGLAISTGFSRKGLSTLLKTSNSILNCLAR